MAEPTPANHNERLRKPRMSIFEVGSGNAVQEIYSTIMSFSRDPHEELLPKAKVTYENTYRLDPVKKYTPDKVKLMIKEVLEDTLKDKHYVGHDSTKLIKLIVDEMRNKVKMFNLKRYKFVCHAVIGEKLGQDVRVGSRCLLDPNRDNFSSAYFENAHLYALGSVYAMYQE